MEQKEHRPHPFDIMVMGMREESPADKKENHLEAVNEEESNQNGDLMSHIETLVIAFSDLKPLVSKVMPLINKWTKS
ncbi:hypothetical protein FZC84_09315 [Rossellomorea vietnamensis]|uniref:Uncharacterized protein n=1 Tax=Rossellomorea vietnamensis TaxID=218284 RepID=A0A5D4MC49_9BACI|nr:hypothetical protein [Rossellomorea vietnamensis]TYR99434.1 hypothetical protein FZC84_09315 [Rossellomorea vietnamensis]